MAAILNKLNDPALVASFQRKCGIIVVERDGQSVPDKTEIAGEGVSNGHVNTNNVHRRNVSCTGSVEESSDVRSDGSSSDDDREKEYIITNSFLYYLFHFAANLGNEIFYITFFPFWFWNIDGYVGRRVCVFWALFMYVGQAAKDIIKWPRPKTPPVVHMEKRYALEYGMPSTHAMVGAGMPFTILYFTHDRYIFPFEYGLAIAVTWCTLVAISRIYLGMHSILDVLAGLGFVFLLMLVFFPFLDAIDDFMLTSPYSPFACLLVPLALGVFYPKLDRWSTARGDTTIIIASAAGVGLGHWFSFQYGVMHRCTEPPPYPIIYPTWLWFGQVWARLVIGVLILFATRALTKALTYNVICAVTGIDKKDVKAVQSLMVELPYKFVTYATISFNTVYIAPQIFRILGIERETFFTEI